MTFPRRIDLALVNGKILTMNPKLEIVQAVAVKSGKVAAVGTSDEIREILDKDTEVIDLKGKTVTPGFIESHCHPCLAGTAILFEVNLNQARSIDEILGLIA
jgi:predicted amidohydrolase YtcJ